MPHVTVIIMGFMFFVVFVVFVVVVVVVVLGVFAIVVKAVKTRLVVVTAFGLNARVPSMILVRRRRSV